MYVREIWKEESRYDRKGMRVRKVGCLVDDRKHRTKLSLPR